MMRRSIFVLILTAVGCGVPVGKTLEPVDVSGTVTVSDKPVTDVILNLQPTGAGTLPVVVPIKDGRFETKAPPGRYAWYVEETKDGKNPKALESIPAEYRAADLDRQLDVTDGTEIEIVIE